VAPFTDLLRRIALAAFAGAAVTGLLLFSVRASEYATKPVFLLKMGLVLVAGMNFLAFTWISRGKGHAAAAPLAALSLLLWTLVLFAGRFIGFL
jgi:apolipoprotein N-acyltransferase